MSARMGGVYGKAPENPTPYLGNEVTGMVSDWNTNGARFVKYGDIRTVSHKDAGCQGCDWVHMKPDGNARYYVDGELVSRETYLAEEAKALGRK